jgi:serine/threonine protein kinase
VNHLEPETVAQYAGGLLEPKERAEVELHIDSCTSCRELTSALARAMSMSSSQPDRPTGDPTGVLPRGTKVGVYELERPLGAGGMGLVYLAFDARLQRQVALKCVRDRQGDSAQLLNEARLMARLAHPNVVPVYDVTEAFGLLFIAMELVPGHTFRSWLEAEPRTWSATSARLLEAGTGLAAAHRAGIVHGDVKPGNVLVGDDGRARVTDFGLASQGADGRAPVRGTENYLAPEQRAGKACDARADQYAFGVMMHEALLGSLPGEPGRRSVPVRVRRVMERALETEPSRRYPSMEALLTELERATNGRRRLAIAAVAIAVVLSLGAFAFGGRRAAAQQCEDAAAELAPPWTPQTRDAIREAFLRVDVPYAKQTLERVEPLLEAWERDFEAARDASCSAPLFSVGPRANQQRQLGCLADQALDARALTAQFLDADVGVVLRALAMAQRLPSPASCLAPKAERPAPLRSEQAREVNRLIAKTRSTAAAGRYKDAMAPALEAAKRAEESGDLGLRALAQTVLGGIQGLTGEHAKASATLVEAVRLAELAQEDRARAFAWTDLVLMEYVRGRHDAVIQWSPAALGACERVDDVRLLSEVMGTLGASLSEKGRNAEARKWLEDAVALRVRAYGENDRRTSAMLSTLANTLAMAGELDGAIDAHTRALAAAEVAFGRTHPEVAVIRQNLGDDFLYGLQGSKALEHLQPALVDLTAVHGAKSREVAICQTDLGLAFLVEGKAREALETFTQAVAAWEQVDPQHPSFGAALLGRAQARLALGERVEPAEFERAEKLARDLPPFEHGRALLEWGVATGDAARVKVAVEELSSTTLPLIAKEKARAEAWLAATGAGR